MPPFTAPSAAWASATTTSIRCDAFSFAMREPRGDDSALGLHPAGAVTLAIPRA